MEKRNLGIFYGIFGIATLLLTVLGATFAYFGALLTSGANAIAGRTLGNNGVLSLTVQEVNFTGVTANHDLFPSNLTTSNIANALTSKCVGAGNYTGCHVYQITASATDDIPSATVTLSQLAYTKPSGITNADTTDWKYAIFDGTVNTAGTGSSVSSLVTSGQFNVSGARPVQIWTGVLSNASGGNNRTITRYLIVWLQDDSSIQNINNSNNSTGSYSGTVELNAGELGKIDACFGMTGECPINSYAYTVNLFNNNSTTLENGTNETAIYLNYAIPSGITKYYDPNGSDQAMTALGKPFFLRHKIVDGVVIESYVGFEVTSAMASANSGMTAGIYYLKGGDNAAFLDNAKTIYDAFGSNCSSNPYTTTISYSFGCAASGLYVNATSNGVVNAVDTTDSAICVIGLSLSPNQPYSYCYKPNA